MAEVFVCQTPNAAMVFAVQQTQFAAEKDAVHRTDGWIRFGDSCFSRFVHLVIPGHDQHSRNTAF